MRKCIRAGLAAIVWITATGLPAGQTIPNVPAATQLNPGLTKVGNGNFIVIGCVSRNAQGASPAYAITDARHEKPVQYRLEGDESLFRVHVGHTVEVGGPVAPPAKGSTASTVKVLSLTYVSTSCAKK